MSKAVELEDTEVAVELVQFAYFKKVRASRLHLRRPLTCNKYRMAFSEPAISANYTPTVRYRSMRNEAQMS